jgi:hypothetical protein
MAGNNGREKYGKLPMTGDKDPEVLPATRVNVASVDNGKSAKSPSAKSPQGLLHQPDEVHVYIEVPGLDVPVALIFKDPMKLARVMRDMAAAGNRCWPKEPEKIGQNGSGHRYLN